MLVLSRREGQSIRIAPDVVVTVIRLTPTVVRLGISAPQHMRVSREDDETIPPKEWGKPNPCFGENNDA